MYSSSSVSVVFHFTYLFFMVFVLDSEELRPILETILVSMVDLRHNISDFLGSFSLSYIFDALCIDS